MFFFLACKYKPIEPTLGKCNGDLISGILNNFDVVNGEFCECQEKCLNSPDCSYFTYGKRNDFKKQCLLHESHKFPVKRDEEVFKNTDHDYHCYYKTGIFLSYFVL